MPHSNITPKTRERAKRLRRELTKAEAAMWNMLRDLRPYGARFRRETPIGPYIADFAWLSARLIVEVDGDSHETRSRPPPRLPPRCIPAQRRLQSAPFRQCPSA